MKIQKMLNESRNVKITFDATMGTLIGVSISKQERILRALPNVIVKGFYSYRDSSEHNHESRPRFQA